MDINSELRESLRDLINIIDTCGLGTPKPLGLYEPTTEGIKLMRARANLARADDEQAAP